MAEDEWTRAKVIKIVLGGRSVVIDEDDDRASFTESERVRSTRPAGLDDGDGGHLRAMVEIQRNVPGLGVPRALLGGVFIREPGEETAFEVSVAADQDDGVCRVCPSMLWAQRPFAVGLPEEFAHAALRGLADGDCSIGLPPGLLRVDRAGFDERESSSPIFELAGGMLRCVLAAKLQGADAEAEARRAMGNW